MTIEILLNGKTQTVSKHQLFALASRGVIGLETVIKVDGKPVKAGKIKGLFEQQQNASIPVPPLSPVVSPTMKVTLNGVERIITNEQLRNLARQEVIGAKTIISIDGKPVKAGKINGLEFGIKLSGKERKQLRKENRERYEIYVPYSQAYSPESFRSYPKLSWVLAGILAGIIIISIVGNGLELLAIFPLLNILFAWHLWGIIARCWRIILDDSEARLKNISFINFFFPFYNIYYFLMSYTGLAKDMNAYCENNEVGTDYRINEKYATIAFILSLIYMQRLGDGHGNYG